MTLAEIVNVLQENHTLASDQVGMTYVDEYETVSGEHQRHQSMTGEKPDYQVILKNSIILLQNGSGHFLVLVSISNAMMQLYKWQGFIESCIFLNKTLNDNWVKLYPSLERLRGRSQMLGWLIERWERYFEANPITSLSADMLSKLLDVIKPLHETLSEKFNNELSLFTLIRPLEDQQKRLTLESASREAKQKLDEEKRQREASDAELRKQQRVMQTLDANAEAVSSDEYLDNMDTQSLFELARAKRFQDNLVLLEQNLTDLSLYLFNRINTWFAYPYTWQEVANMIDDNELDWDAYSQALKLYAMADYEKALIAFEALFQRYPYFLDCQYYIIQCIESIDKDAKPLVDTLEELVRTLAKLYPDLEKATTKEGVRLCSKQTIQRFEIFKKVLDTSANVIN